MIDAPFLGEYFGRLAEPAEPEADAAEDWGWLLDLAMDGTPTETIEKMKIEFSPQNVFFSFFFRAF